MAKMKVSDIEKLISPILLNEGLELVDVEFKKEPVGMVLRTYIDSENGVDLDTCSRASKILLRELDKSNLIEQNYILEVSSPGIEKPLRKPEHFKKFIGSKIFVKTKVAIEKRKQFKGMLKVAKDDTFEVDCDGKIFKIPYDILGKAHLIVDIDL